MHDGGEAAPAYEVSVSDGVLNTAPAGASVTFTNVNDAPVLVNNVLTIEEGETVTLDAADLSATDVDTADSTLDVHGVDPQRRAVRGGECGRERRSRASPSSS